MDMYSEDMYSGIFLGQKKHENKECMVKVHYSDICKSELIRGAICVENIFKEIQDSYINREHQTS